MAAAGAASLFVDHTTHWAAHYPKSFVTVAQPPGVADDSTALEGFHWIQMCKLGSAIRPGGPALDLMGPWFQPSSWLYYWFDLNVQLQCWPLCTANRLALAETLVHLVTTHPTELAANTAGHGNGVSGIGGACPYNMECIVPTMGGKGAPMVGDGPWIMHNLYLHAIRAPNTSMLTETVFPLLRRTTQMYLTNAFEIDGVWHLPPTDSPEYPFQTLGGDANYDLALFEWGLRTLVELADEHAPADAMPPRWRAVLSNITSGPTDANGYMVNNRTGFDHPHRHFSHAFHIYPLHLITGDFSKLDLAERTLDRWAGLTCGGPTQKSCPNGFTYDGAASISALVGRPDDAVGCLTAFIASSKVHASTIVLRGRKSMHRIATCRGEHAPGASARLVGIEDPGLCRPAEELPGCHLCVVAGRGRDRNHRPAQRRPDAVCRGHRRWHLPDGRHRHRHDWHARGHRRSAGRV